MLIICKDSITTIIHIPIGTAYFNTIVHCREVNRFFCLILYYCDPFVCRIGTDIRRCFRTFIFIVTNTELFRIDILCLTLRYEKSITFPDTLFLFPIINFLFNFKQLVKPFICHSQLVVQEIVIRRYTIHIV